MPRPSAQTLLRVLALCLAGLAMGLANAGPERVPRSLDLILVPVATRLHLPVAAVGLDDGERFLVVQLDGRVSLLEDHEVRVRPFLSLRERVDSQVGEQGLYSLALHPDFAENGRFFVAYAHQETGDLILAEHHVSAAGDRLLDDRVAEPNPDRVLLALPFPEPYHYGGQLAFGPDGYLYFGVGDGTESIEAFRNGVPPSQDLSVLHGKVLRLDVDRGPPYAVPRDNPFVDTPGARPEIFATGFRNPWKFSFDSETGELYLVDGGAGRWEEINLVVPGGNYGWPAREGTQCLRFPDARALVVPGCPRAGDFLPPLASYGHPDIEEPGAHALTGGYVYRGARYPALAGRYLFGDFVSGRVWTLYRDPEGAWRSEVMLDTELAISGFAVDTAGELYLLDMRGGLYQIGVAE